LLPTPPYSKLSFGSISGSLAYQHVVATFTRLNFDPESLRQHRFLVFGLPWAQRRNLKPTELRLASLTYVIMLSGIAHGVWSE